MHDVLVIGAGAAGLFFSGVASAFGLDVLLLDHQEKIGEKIRISGGGRCNFTNIHSGPEHFLSQNSQFAQTALRQYRPEDFVGLVKSHKIPFHEKKLGQLFCDRSAQDIIDMLWEECRKHQVKHHFGHAIIDLSRKPDSWFVKTNAGEYHAQSLVVATGGLSIPKIGATNFAYELAEKFKVNIIPTRPALVPLTFTDQMLDFCSQLSGLSVDAKISCNDMAFEEGLLFAHRGLTGPSILQISSYWREGDSIDLDLIPSENMREQFLQAKDLHGKQDVQQYLTRYLPKRLAAAICTQHGMSGKMAEQANKKLTAFAKQLHGWSVKPGGTEGYRKAEVTLGGVDTKELSPTDMQCIKVPNLHFIGEAVDVTGHLGGHNFQWAWASAHAAAMSMAKRINQ